jgi:HSP20 family protein
LRGIADFRLPIADFLSGLVNAGPVQIDNRQLAIGNDLTYPAVMRNSDREFSLITSDRRVKPSGRLWNPSADVYRTPDGWIVKLDLAGICSDDLEVELSDTILTIRGCRRDTQFREGFVYHQMEITYSRFEKQIQFPSPIEGASVERDYNDGFLIIRLRSE